MNSLVRFVMAVAAVVLVAAPAIADWDETEQYKMHWPQLPNPDGWDVNFGWPKILADDWMCSETGPVKDVHFWFSWEEDGGFPATEMVPPPAFGVHVSIHKDVPAGTDPGVDYSHPGEQLWQRDYGPDQVTVRHYGFGEQGWYDPNEPYYRPNDHNNIWQANITDILKPFRQERGTIYWLDLSILPIAGIDPPMLGWKTTLPKPFPQNDPAMWEWGGGWNDDAVWGDDFDGDGQADFWNEMWDPIENVSLDLAFVITPEPSTVAMLLGVGLMGLLGLVRRRRK